MSKIFDSVVGFVVGDAIGVPIEFEDREKLMKEPITTMQGYGSYDVPEGVWSDDTSMTLATIDSIISCNDVNYNDIADKFCNWINNADYTATNEMFDIGITTKYALMRYWEDKSDATKCGGSDISSNGNGSLMRMLPIVLYCHYKNLEDNEIFNIVRNVSSITHAHEISIMGCYIYVKYLLYILEGNDKITSYHMIKELNYLKYFNEETIGEYKRILENDITNLEINDIKSTGFVVSTLETVMWVILNCDSYSQSIIGSINLGGDTDTIGAITGSIAGLIYGFDSIPDKWLSKIKNTDYLYNLLNKFENVLCQSKKDAIVGAMIGDIVGSRFELNNCRKKQFDFMPKKKCRITDDTVMTLAVAKTLIEADGNYNYLSDIAIKNMVEVGRKYQQCGFGRSFFEWIKSDNHEPYNSYGNGAAMRISACGIVSSNEKEVKDISYKITAVSHNHPDGIKGAEAVAMMIYLARQGKSKEELKQVFTSDYYPIDFTVKELNKNYKFKISCAETVPQAFVAFYESVNFEDAIRNAISIGGDSDTIGAITGSIASVYYGIPNYLYEHALSFTDEYLKDIYEKFNIKFNK